MKNILLLPLAGLILFFVSCKPELPTYFEFDAYEYASLDEQGGTWKPILLTQPDQIGIPAPSAAASAEFLA